MIGTKLGPYEITEEIGKGGMATVFRAYQPSMDRHVAVKVIRASMLGDKLGRDRFQREARVVAKLEHPHLLPIYDFDGEHDPPFIVMRFLEGGTLKQVMEAGPLPPSEMIYTLRQVALALDYAHRQGVVHRDLKPSNIMIDREGNVFVADFGIARVTDAPRDLTGTGVVMGTPGYMAPEQARGKAEVDGRADVYSLGVIMFEMLAGRGPFERESPLDELMAHIQEVPPDVREFNSSLPKAVSQVLHRALAKEPAQRQETAGELVRELAEALQADSSSAPAQLRSLTQSFAAQQLAALEQAVEEARTPSDVQRQMTALFMDITDYAEMLYQSEETEAVRKEIDRLWMAFQGAAEASDGLLESRTGEAGLLLWGREETRESDPEQAVQAALRMRAALEKAAQARWGESEEPLPFKAALITGPVLLTREADGTTSVSGTAITLAGRLKEAAPPGEILVAHDTYTHVRGVFDVRQLPPVRMRGRNEPVEVYVILRARPRAFRQQARGIEGIETKMIGREPELKVLQDAMGLTIEDRETQVVTVVGEAGVGKSRLLYEFTNWVDLMEEKLWFFEARATQPSMLQPYSLTRDLFSFRFKILDNDPLSAVHEKFEAGIAGFLNGGGSREAAHMIGQLVGFDFSESPVVKPKLEQPEAFHQEALALLGRFFLTAAGTSPVFIQVEDIHWADDRSLDLLNSLARENTAIPLFIIYMARPQLYDRRPSWGEGQGFHARINLQPLSRLDSRRLVRELLKKVDQVPTELRDLIIDRAEGNPFYMEELVKALIDDGVIVKGEDSWHVQQEKFAAVRVPPTLVGVLQSRLDSFPPGQRTLLQRASVVGRIFWESAVVQLSAAEGVTAGAVGGMLEDLREREMVFKREESAFEGTPEYGFRHAILRDVVYETIVPSQRRNYHKLVAEWLTEAGRDRLDEYNPLIAEHYERAEAYPQAAVRLREVARRASVVGSMDEAIRILQRGLNMLPPEPTKLRMDLQIQLGSALAIKGSYDEAIAELQPALQTARQLGERSAEAVALAELGRITGVFRGDEEAGQAYFDQALPIARELQDLPALVFITRQLGNIGNALGELEQARAHLEESLSLARQIGDRASEVNALNSLGINARARDDFAEALRHYQQGLDLVVEIGDRHLRAMLTQNVAEIHYLQGDFAAAKRLSQRAMALAQEAANDSLAAGSRFWLGVSMLRLGEAEQARLHMDEALRMVAAMRWDPAMVYSLPEYARQWAGSGDVIKAVEWIGLALHHPASDFVSRRYTQQVLGEIRGDLSEPEVQAALERGAKLDLDALIQELLSEA
jgi:serine/threonine protein kinase/tetratricopeptide (TPR) repeat protein